MPPTTQLNDILTEVSGTHPQICWHQILGIYQNSRECREKQQPNDNAQHPGPEKICAGEQQRKRRHTQNRNPNDILAANPVASIVLTVDVVRSIENISF
jgi:hypothetical protein